MKNGLFLLKTGIAPIFFRFEDFYNAHRMNKISASLNLLTGATCADDPVADLCRIPNTGLAGRQGTIALEGIRREGTIVGDDVGKQALRHQHLSMDGAGSAVVRAAFHPAC